MADAEPVAWVGDPRHPLTVEDVVAVARTFRRVRIAPHAMHRVELGRAAVDALIAGRAKVYGITTGFASLRDTAIDPRDAARLSANLIRSHSTGVGRPFAEDVVRATLLLRAQALAQGNSGVRPGFLRRLVALLNAGIYPLVPEQGSLGSSGDLAPLSHAFLAFLGEPEARVHRRLLEPGAWTPSSGPGRAADLAEPRASDFVALGPESAAGPGTVRRRLADALAETLEADGFGAPRRPGYDADGHTFGLEAKEGLAANNGAVFTAAIAALACHDAGRLLATADLVAALSFEAHQAVGDCLDERLVALRPHPGHVVSAGNLRRALAGSDLVRPQAPSALNRARYNRALVALHDLLRGLEAPDGGVGPAARAPAAELLAAMQAAQRSLFDAASAAPAPPEAPETGAKIREVRARRAGFQALDEAWRRVIGWPAARVEKGTRPSDEPREPTCRHPHVRERLAALYHAHVAGIVRPPDDPEIQDNYSFRCAPTVMGTAWEALERCREAVRVEIGATTDNPILCLDALCSALGLETAGTTSEALTARLRGREGLAADAVLSGGNFHGEPIGAVCDHLAAAVAEVGNVAERRLAVLTDAKHSKGLPSYLSWKPGLNSGFMMLQYTAASLVMENRHQAMPASTDSVPTGEMTEDLVAMSTYATRKCATVIANAERIVAMELLCAYQGVQFRKPCRLGRGTAALEALVAARLGPLFLALGRFEGVSDAERLDAFRRHLAGLGLAPASIAGVSPCLLDDVVPHPLVEAATALLHGGEPAALARA